MLRGLALLAVATTLWSDELPPQRFRQPSGWVMLIVEPELIVRKLCEREGQPADVEPLGCAGISKDGDNYLIVPDPCPYAEEGETYARVLCHERAHLAGWPPTHGP